MHTLTKRLGIWALVVALILLVPYFGKWPWTGSDFVFGAILLFGAATVYEYIARNMGTENRVITGMVVAGALAVIWVYAATGFERFLG